MKKVLRFVLLVLIILLIGGGIYFLFNKIQISKITCESQYGKCNSNLQSSINNLETKKENIVKTREDLNKLLRSDKSILDYRIDLGLPLIYKVYVIQRKPIVAFLSKDGTFLLIDKDGIIVDRQAKTSLPEVVTIELTHDQVVYSANLVSELYTFFGVNSAKITQDGIEITNISNKKVLFPLSGDIDVLLGSLKLILSRLPSVKEASTISVIDLRFKNPVLR